MDERDEQIVDELRRALRKPVALPDGFTERIVGAVARQQEQRGGPFLSQPQWRKAVAATILLTAMVGGSEGYLAVQHQKAMQTEAQVAMAMQITGAALRETAGDVDAQVRGAVNTLKTSETGKAER